MKILIADDHQLILNGLISVLSQQFPQAICKGAIDKTALFEALELDEYDILIQDLKFGADNAEDFMDDLRVNYPSLKVVLLTTISDSITIKQLSKKVDAYVLKSEPVQEIIKAINMVKTGETYLSEQTSFKISHLCQEEEIILTTREREVLEVIMQEKSIKQIAEILCISEKTVELHRGNLFIKLDVKNITGLVKKAIALNLLD